MNAAGGWPRSSPKTGVSVCLADRRKATEDIWRVTVQTGQLHVVSLRHLHRTRDFLAMPYRTPTCHISYSRLSCGFLSTRHSNKEK